MSLTHLHLHFPLLTIACWLRSLRIYLSNVPWLPGFPVQKWWMSPPTCQFPWPQGRIYPSINWHRASEMQNTVPTCWARSSLYCHSEHIPKKIRYSTKKLIFQFWAFFHFFSVFTCLSLRVATASQCTVPKYSLQFFVILILVKIGNGNIQTRFAGLLSVGVLPGTHFLLR